MKKVVVFFAAAFALCATNKVAAQTQIDSGTTGSCTWELTANNGDTILTISGNGAMGDYSGSSSVPWYSYSNSIKTLDIQQGVTTIGDYAFFRCSGLTSVTIGNSVTTIGNDAFVFCNGLTSVTIGNAVTSIGRQAFSVCSNLTTITIPNSVISIGESAFAGCRNLTSIDVDANNTHYSSVDGVLFNKLQDTLIQYPEGKQGDYTIPNTVTSIESWAFGDCYNLTSVTIPNSVITIGEFAFFRCSGLTEIHVKAKTPPQIMVVTFAEVPTDIPVYVCGEVEDYRNAEHWGNFTNILPDNNCNIAVEDLVAADIINIYPNPATDNIVISLRENITNAVFTLYDMQGKVLIRQAVTNEDVISVSEFAAGIYIYNVSTGKERYQGKIVISE
jgi:hypothetical protein